MPRRIPSYLFVVTLAALWLAPPLWVFLTSFKTETEYFAYPIRILPAVPQWANYALAVTRIPFLRHLRNTVLLASMYTALTVLSSALVGFGFARHNAPGKNLLFMLVLSILILPRMVTLIPQFVVFARIGLVGNYLPWLLWGLTASPWHVFLFRQYFAAFPSELEDAAEVDGCGRFRTFWQIFLPNSMNVVLTSALFNFQFVWGDLMNPLLFLPDRMTTLAVKLAFGYLDPRGNQIYTPAMAAVVLYTLPVIAVFFFGQRYIMQGVLTSGLKG